MLALVAVCFTSGAQSYYQDSKNSEIFCHAERHEPCRKEIVIPQVNGYNVYKADLHTHTVFSDGQVMPNFRVNEAWQDGLDIMAVTEHIEYRPREATFVNYLEKYRSDKYKKAVNTSIGNGKPIKGEIMVDLNRSVIEAKKAAAKLGLVIIPGSEITRNGTTVGHFNALFTTDNNLIFDPDPVQAIRNAKAQGALVMHNHPGWRRTNLDFTEAEVLAYGEGLIDGVEVMNGSEFYPGIIDRVQERELFIAANSDIHGTTANEYRLTGSLRPMTLILAKDKSLESLKEALVEDRTIAMSFNTLCGSAQLLEDFFAACVTVGIVEGEDDNTTPQLMLTNNSSIPFVIRKDGSNQRRLDPFSTITIKAGKKASSLKLTVLNMLCSKDSHPVVNLKFK